MSTKRVVARARKAEAVTTDLPPIATSEGAVMLLILAAVFGCIGFLAGAYL